VAWTPKIGPLSLPAKYPGNSYSVVTDGLAQNAHAPPGNGIIAGLPTEELHHLQPMSNVFRGTGGKSCSKLPPSGSFLFP